MVREIRVYFEGYRKLRPGFSAFFREVVDAASKLKVGWELVSCKGRGEALDDFNRACRTHTDAFNVLLVDAEDVPTADPISHLRQHPDAWERPDGVRQEQVHLMIVVMETWLVADPDSLEAYYGQRFRAARLPRRSNLEQVPKGEVLSSLEAATSDTKKGAYHKTRHAPYLLERIRPAKVRVRAPACDRLFRTLLELLSD